MKKILILGIGNAQKDIIEYCKVKGFFVCAVSNDAGYSAEKIVDEFFMLDIVDVDQIIRLVRDKSIDFVYSVGSDVAMPSIAKVCEALQLPCFVGTKTAFLCNHKQLLRQTMGNSAKGNIPYQIIESVDEGINLEFPIMMKPADSQGQRGVRKVENIDDLKKHFARTMAYSREKKVILESFIDGDEISVNVFLENGSLKFFLISDREVWEKYPGGIIKEHMIPSKYEENTVIMAKVKKLVEDMLDVIGLKNGPAYFQIKINSLGEPYLIEVTPRLDGCHMWRLIKYATGVNLLEAAVDLLTGKSYRQVENFAVQPYSLEFLCGKPETVFYKSQYTIPQNIYIEWYYEEGQKIKQVNGYFEKCGYVIKKGY